MAVGEGADGWPAEKLLGGPAAYGCGFDDFTFLPALEASASEVEKLSARFSKNISLHMPFVGPPSPTVTAEHMAVALSLAGGIGIIHKQQSIEEQVAMVRRVKEHETAFILNPATLGPRATIGDAEQIMQKVGCSCIPITDNGRMGGRLIGLVTRRDLDAVADEPDLPAHEQPLNSVMVAVPDVLTASEPVTYREAQALMLKHKVAKLPVVNSERELVALICRGDGKRSVRHPFATRDPNTQLLVAASVTADEETLGDGAGFDRALALVDAGVDALLLETDHGVSEATLAFLKRLKATFLTTDVICGRVSSVRQAEDLVKTDCDGLLVGAPQNPGYLAPATAQTSGLTEASLLFQIARHARMNGLPVIAEGGIRTEADVVKAFCLGASTVAPGPLLARTSDSPGEHCYRNGVRIKLRGAPSRGGAANRALPRYGETFEGPLVDTGSVDELLEHLCRGVRGGLKSLGLKGLSDVHPSLASGAVRMELVRPYSATSGVPPGLLQVKRLTTSPLYSRW